MWSLKPYHSPPSICPGCNCQNYGFREYFFTGVHILGKGCCSGCGMEYYHNWPVGHGADFPIAFSTNGVAKFPDKAAMWMAKPLIKAIKKNLRTDAPVFRRVRNVVTTGLILNCLDPCYGHVIWKLLGASRYRDIAPPSGVVVLIPVNCEWMVPDFVAEIWSVDIPLSKLNLQVDSVQRFINQVSTDYDCLKLLPVATHLDHSGIDLQQFFRVRPFQLENFNSDIRHISFIWREDRFWFRSRIEEWLHPFLVKLPVKLVQNWFLNRQLKAMVAVAKRVRREIPKTAFKAIGLGTWGEFPEYFEDLRRESLTTSWELKWCEAYARSQLVIGVHGSNMLIPTALSAGFIELIPRSKIPFMTEDILLDHPSRFQTFLGRHLDLFTAPEKVAQHVISIFRDFNYLYKNTAEGS